MSLFLQNLRILCERRAIPIISQATENFLKEILQKYKPQLCLEIGGAIGYSSIFVGGIVQKRGGQVISFEISYPAYLEGLIHLRESGLLNITSYPGDFRKWPLKKLLPKKVDFVFVDGQKSQYAEYLEIIENFISDTTLLVLDDVIKYHNKLDSLYRFLQKKQINYQIKQLEVDDGVMIIPPLY